MQTSIEFLLKISLFWLLSLAWYQVFLRNQQRFRANRLFLLASLLGVPLVFLGLSYFDFGEKIYAINFLGGAVQAGSDALSEPMQQTWPLWLSLLLGGISIGFIRLTWSLIQLNTIFRKAKRESFNGHLLLRIPNSTDCYTFFGFVVLGADVPDEDIPCMLEHELAHRKLGHSWDILLAEITCIFFWFHPLVYLYKAFLLEVHEYQADQTVLRNFKLITYSDLLLQRAMNTRVSLFHTFSNQSQLKKRLMMMTKLNQPQTASWKYWLAMPFLLALVFALNIQTAQAQVVEENPDEMPYYGDCEAIAKEERQACTMKGLIQDLYSNIKYPESAQKEGKEGKVFVEFYIDKSGKVTNAKVLKGFHPDCDAEALRAINNLKDWSPGKKEGKPILVKMVLPVAFKLA